MKKKLLLFFIVTCFYLPLKAQDFVVYNGDTEKTLINSAQTADDFIKLSLASELGEGEPQVVYDKFIQDVKQLNLQAAVGDRTEKHLKKVYQIVHDHFLKTYNPQAHFGDFIVNGEYRDISATILYAYILETLNVPYQIKQFPAHVYVIVNPGTDDIPFETVDQSKGFYVFDNQTKQQDVNELIQAGYIDQSYAMRVGVERVFNDFFYDKTDISLKEAVGILYFDKALEEMQANKVFDAYSDISKSDMIYPDRKNEFVQTTLMAAMLNSFKYDDIKDWRILTKLVNNKNASQEIKNYMRNQFQNFINDKLINSGQKDKVDEVYNYLHTSVADTALRKLITIDYFFESAHYYYLTSDYSQALDCLEIAYKLNPKNPLVISDFVQMILRKYSSGTPSAQSLDDFDKYLDGYPSLRNNPVIAALHEYYLSCLSIIGFVSGDGVTGEKYMHSLVDELEAHPDHDNRFDQVIASVFAKASIYYFRKQEKQKAIAVINLGLKYEPKSDELLRKLKADSGN